MAFVFLDELPIHQELSEFILLQETDDKNFFNRDRILALISRYKMYRGKVGTYNIKNMRKLWEVIAKDLSEIFKITISASKCENKWKVLERNYKAVVDNNNKSGRSRKVFEFEKDFDEIYFNKKNVKPLIILSSDTVCAGFTNREMTVAAVSSSQNESVENIRVTGDIAIGSNAVLAEGSSSSTEPIPVISINETEKQNIPTKKRKVIRKNITYQKRNDILSEMKNDLKDYYKKKLDIEQKKLELREKSLSEKLRRTDLYENHLKECNNQNLPSNPFLLE